jgi:hypothetical protein
MKRLNQFALFAFLSLGICARADVYNLKVVTDASPDYSDMDSLIHSVSSKWQKPDEKLWAMFYWNHVARRQTAPMNVHGKALTDPIRQFNDYGFTMCSTISGMNNAIWHAMGFPAKYWDISNHTVAEVFYDGRWHMYDNSLSALYTLCDGKTLAGVEDIGKEGACEASGGKVEKGHVALYHCLNATSPKGFLTGSDTIRTLRDEVAVFNPNGLKFRSYYHDWEAGHRYILNLRDGESYTRFYKSQGDAPEYFVPNGTKDPEKQSNFGIRGNGVRIYKPNLAELNKSAHSFSGVRFGANGVAGKGEVVFKVEGANVISSLKINAALEGENTVSISTTNGLQWQEISQNAAAVSAALRDEVSGAYEVLVKISLADKAILKSLDFETITMLNAKTQPRLNWGKNTVYVGAGEQTGSIVLWPELQNNRALPLIVEKQNVAFAKEHPGYMGALYAEKANEPAWVVFKIDAPNDITKFTYGGRLYNRAPKAHIDFLHSFDGGKTWLQTYSLTDTNQPWDVIHYETVRDVPKGTRSVLFKYLLNASEAGANACSIYSLRMEANYKTDAIFKPLEVIFNWSERQNDYSLIERSHTQLVSKLPFKYEINVGGADHPLVNFLRVREASEIREVKYGYSDGRDAGGEKWIPNWASYGKNLAIGKSYTLSQPSETNWGAGDPDGKKLTDGIVGPTFSGGTSYATGAIWSANKNPVITLDLGAPQKCATFGLNIHGYEGKDALRGQVPDKIEVLTSPDGVNFTSQGYGQTALRRKDIPINFLLPDDETLRGFTARLVPKEPVETRWVQFKISNKRFLAVTEIEVLDSLNLMPYDLRVDLPDENAKPRVVSNAKPVLVAAAPAAHNDAAPVGEPTLEPPTLHSLGAYWIISGDDNKNAQVNLEYKIAGTANWQKGLPFLRVQKGAHKNEGGKSQINVPDGAWLFAGSALLLEPNTEYEVRLSLSDPDGGSAQKGFTIRTRSEPRHFQVQKPYPYYVVPGNGGGDGSKQNPFKGLNAAQAVAKPGTTFLLQSGVYEGTFNVTKSGSSTGRIVWIGEGEVIIDGQGGAAQRPGRAISANNVENVWFENLTIRNAEYGFVGHNSENIVIRGCKFSGVDYGITCTNNDSGKVRGWFIADNVLEGPSSWPRTKGIENARGIQVTGSGHDICYNRISGFADAIDTFGSQQCAAIDIHHNEISEMTDDGIETDYSERNVRVFFNRLTNVFQGISTQPIFGGPVYIFRNAMFNVVVAPFKMHNSPSGALMLHNTSVKRGQALECYPGVPVRNTLFRNNLFIGTSGNYAFESTAPMQECDFDFDGFGGSYAQFLKWNNVRYDSIADAKKRAPVYKNAVQVEAAPFASGAVPPADEKMQAAITYLSLKPGSAAIDAGTPLAGFRFNGAAPDLGAYETGESLPRYGPRRMDVLLNR